MRRLFFWIVLPSILAVITPSFAFAAPMTTAVGAAQATLQFVPDPPQVGKNHAVITLAGAPLDQIARTTASFGTLMPTMSMTGPSGTAKQTAPGKWEFDAMLGMASTWDVTVKFAGGVRGSATFHFNVLAPNSKAAASSASADAWRVAIPVLLIILVVGVFAVRRARSGKRLAIGITAGAAVLTLILAFVQARYAAPSMDMAAMSSVAGTAAIPVTAVAAREAGSGSEIFAPGTVAPYLTQDIVTRQSGILTHFTAYAGDHVRAGQVIASLDAPEVQSRARAAAADADGAAAAAQAAQIEAAHHAPNGVVIAQAQVGASEQDLRSAQAEAIAKTEQLRYWQNEIAREKSLLGQGAVSQQEYQDELAQAAVARAAARSAELRIGSLREQVTTARTKAMDAHASVDQMRAQAVSAQAQAARARSSAETEATLAGYTTIISPDDAIVVKRLVDPGVYVQNGTAIARITVLDRLRLQANVAQRNLALVGPGSQITATLPDGITVHGRLTSVSPVADPVTHTASVEAILTNPRRDFVPGGYVRVRIHAGASRMAGGFTVPSAAIVGSGSDAAVWLIAVDKTAHRVPVRVANDDGVNATVSGALSRGARVVVEGAPALEEGQPLTEDHP